MIDHIGLPCTDPAASAEFWLRVFAPLGVREAVRIPTPAGPVVGLAGPGGGPDLWCAPAEGHGSRPVHLALGAPTRGAVDAVHAAALGAGAEVLHAPRVWPEHHEHYYAVFVRDADGNNAEAVCHRPPG
ncbi:VOC family protein [Kineococcus terrestris]|uniref:VOC family protein n=1 Tax=Kineococcus terrestris TaxID=2044856 RepID=UPI0034DB3BDC